MDKKMPGYTGYKPQFYDEKAGHYDQKGVSRDNRYYIPGRCPLLTDPLPGWVTNHPGSHLGPPDQHLAPPIKANPSVSERATGWCEWGSKSIFARAELRAWEIYCEP